MTPALHPALHPCLTTKDVKDIAFQETLGGSRWSKCTSFSLFLTFPPHVIVVQFSSVAQSCPTLWPYEPQHNRFPCPSPTPRVHPNPCPLSRWYHPTISSSVVPFSSCPQSLPASESFPMSQLFTSGGQSIKVSASTPVLPMNTQDWSPLGGLVGSPCSTRDSQASSSTPQSKSIHSLALSFLYSLTLTSIHDYWKNHSLD